MGPAYTSLLIAPTFFPCKCFSIQCLYTSYIQCLYTFYIPHCFKYTIYLQFVKLHSVNVFAEDIDIAVIFMTTEKSGKSIIIQLNR